MLLFGVVPIFQIIYTLCNLHSNNTTNSTSFTYHSNVQRIRSLQARATPPFQASLSVWRLSPSSGPRPQHTHASVHASYAAAHLHSAAATLSTLESHGASLEFWRPMELQPYRHRLATLQRIQICGASLGYPMTARRLILCGYGCLSSFRYSSILIPPQAASVSD